MDWDDFTFRPFWYKECDGVPLVLIDISGIIGIEDKKIIIIKTV